MLDRRSTEDGNGHHLHVEFGPPAVPLGTAATTSHGILTLVTTSDDAILSAIKTLSDELNSKIDKLTAQQDVLRALIDDVRAEQRVQALETRSGTAEVKLAVLEQSTRLVTLFDELAAFRREYNEHGHPDS